MSFRSRLSIGTWLLLGLLAACGTVSGSAEAPALDGTAWTLSGLPGRSLVAKATPTLQFSGGRVSGSDGCNRYSGTYTVNGRSLEVGSQLASTRMACLPAVAAQSQAYVVALTAARSYGVVDGPLELLSASGQPLATFAAQSQSLAGTTWHVTGVNNGKGGVVSVLNGTTVTLSFSDDDRVSGSAGCNNYTGAYRAEGSTLAFAQAAATRKMCMQPAAGALALSAIRAE